MEIEIANQAKIDWRSLEKIGSGAFAHVFVLDCERVLKLTCCEATQALFARALQAPGRWPSGLPTIFECVGVEAIDADGLRYVGYVMERLYRPQEWSTESRRARALDAARRCKNGGTNPVMPMAQVEELQALVTLAQRYQPSPELGGRAAQQEFALRMASATRDGLRAAFITLALFIAEYPACFDLQNVDNFLLDCQGNVRLADPVSIGCDEPGETGTCTYIMAKVPSRLSGFEVELQPCARPAYSDEEVDATLKALQRLGLKTQSTRDPRELARFLQAPLSSGSVFDFPQLKTRLCSGEFVKALYA